MLYLQIFILCQGEWTSVGRLSVGANHIEERMKTEEKAKVVASVRSEEFIQFLAALAVLPRKICKNRMNSS